MTSSSSPPLQYGLDTMILVYSLLREWLSHSHPQAFGMRNAESGVRNAECGFGKDKWRMTDGGWRMPRRVGPPTCRPARLEPLALSVSGHDRMGNGRVTASG